MLDRHQAAENTGNGPGSAVRSGVSGPVRSPALEPPSQWAGGTPALAPLACRGPGDVREAERLGARPAARPRPRRPGHCGPLPARPGRRPRAPGAGTRPARTLPWCPRSAGCRRSRGPLRLYGCRAVRAVARRCARSRPQRVWSTNRWGRPASAPGRPARQSRRSRFPAPSPGEPARPEHDTVDVGAEDAAVGLVRNGCQLALAGRHAGVQAGQVDRPHLFPRLGVGDVEAVPEIEHLDLGSLLAEEGGDGGADPRSAAGDECRTGEHRGIQY